MGILKVKENSSYEALQWTGNNKEEVKDFCGNDCLFAVYGYDTEETGHAKERVLIHNENSSASMRYADVNDYIIKVNNGEYLTCDEATFKKRYAIINNSDTYSKKMDTVKELLGVKEIGDISDGYHTFNELYHHRAVLFSVICNQNKVFAWKSKKHNDGSMYDGMFIVGIETAYGQATYHYDIDPYWDMFHVKEYEKAPLWDGHTPEQAIDRIAKFGAALYLKK